jgi:hypothetical protein
MEILFYTNFLLNILILFNINILKMPEWRNGRRGRLKIGWGNPCGFDSHLGHQNIFQLNIIIEIPII